MLKLKMTQVYLDPGDAKRLKRLAENLSRAESRRVTASELIRRAIREFLARQEK
jgi:predicted transcriptional regulator